MDGLVLFIDLERNPDQFAVHGVYPSEPGVVNALDAIYAMRIPGKILKDFEDFGKLVFAEVSGVLSKVLRDPELVCHGASAADLLPKLSEGDLPTGFDCFEAFAGSLVKSRISRDKQMAYGEAGGMGPGLIRSLRRVGRFHGGLPELIHALTIQGDASISVYTNVLECPASLIGQTRPIASVGMLEEAVTPVSRAPCQSATVSRRVTLTESPELAARNRERTLAISAQAWHQWGWDFLLRMLLVFRCPS
jgi:hypothetical protein